MKKILYTTALIAIAAGAQAQAVGINSTGATPNSSSILDLNTGNTFGSPNGKGLLPPNVPLTGITDNVTVASPATSLLVYNTATANTGTLSVVPGYYYWDGTKWVALGGSDWHTTGNLGTTAGTNFLGTTDAQDMVFKTNSVENMRIANATGNVGIGTTTPAAKLSIVATATNTGFQLQDGTQGAGRVLTSDVNGMASWQTAITPTLVWYIKSNSFPFTWVPSSSSSYPPFTTSNCTFSIVSSNITGASTSGNTLILPPGSYNLSVNADIAGSEWALYRITITDMSNNVLYTSLLSGIEWAAGPLLPFTATANVKVSVSNITSTVAGAVNATYTNFGNAALNFYLMVAKVQ